MEFDLKKVNAGDTVLVRFINKTVFGSSLRLRRAVLGKPVLDAPGCWLVKVEGESHSRVVNYRNIRLLTPKEATSEPKKSPLPET